MKSKRNHLLFAMASLFVIAALALSACGGPIDSNGKNDDKPENGKNEKIAICHKTGSEKNPFVEIFVSGNAADNGHAKHEGDLIPAPEGGCP